MNKIIVDKEKIIELNILEDSVCNIKNRCDIEKIIIRLNDNVEFILNEYSEIDKRDYSIEVIQNNNSSFIYNHSFIVSDLYNLNININMNGNNSNNVINIHGINDSGKSNIIVDGTVKDNTKDNNLDEKIRILNINNGKSHILPNMYINTKNVIANHAASITDIDKNYLFYMNSKGIDCDKAKELIINGFLDNDAK